MTSITEALPLIQSVLDDASLPRDQHDALSKAADIIAAQNGVTAIAAERQRQIAVEGWTPDHDDRHTARELARAAAEYAAHAGAEDVGRLPFPTGQPSDGWPWDAAWWKPTDPRHDLARAGALCAAEIDRLDRAAQIRASRATPSTTPAQDQKA